MRTLIMQMPTMENPEALYSVPDLRAALHAANQSIFALHAELVELSTTLDACSWVLNGLAASHAAGQADDLRHKLDMLVRQEEVAG